MNQYKIDYKEALEVLDEEFPGIIYYKDNKKSIINNRFIQFIIQFILKRILGDCYYCNNDNCNNCSDFWFHQQNFRSNIGVCIIFIIFL